MPSPQRRLFLSFFPVTVLLAAASALCLSAPGARAAAMAAADASGGYAGKMLNKVVEIWAPPPALKGDFQVQVKVALDGTGHVQNCTPARPSGMEALDSSACGAVRQIGSFGKPPKVVGYSQDSTPATVAIGASANSGNGPAAAAPKAPALTIAPTPLSAPPPSGPEGTTANAAQGAVADAPAPSSPANTAAQSATQPDGPTTYGPDNKAQFRYGKKHNKYFSNLSRELANAIIIPVETPLGTYYPTVRLTVDPATGAIAGFTFLEKSGDKYLDSFVSRGIKKAGSITPPPADLGTTLDITLTLVRR